jgi:gas vesicle protein
MPELLLIQLLSVYFFAAMHALGVPILVFLALRLVFWRRISSTRGKIVLASVLAVIGAVYVLSDVLWPLKTMATADLKQTSGVVENSRLVFERFRTPRRTSHYNHQVLIKLKNSSDAFVYVAEPSRLDEASRIVGANVKITHLEGSTSVWGLEINGVVFATPEQRNERERKELNSFLLIKLQLLALATVIGWFTGTKAHIRKKESLAHAEKSDQSPATPQNQRVQTIESRSNSAVPASATELERSPTVAKRIEQRSNQDVSRRWQDRHDSDQKVAQIFLMPVGLLWGVIVVRWYWSTQLPKTELGFGGIAYAFIALFVFVIAYLVATVLLHVVTKVLPATARTGFLLLAIVGSFIALLMQQQSADELRHRTEAQDRVTIAAIQARETQQREYEKQKVERDQANAAAIQEREKQAKLNEKATELQKSERLEREFKEALARIPDEMAKVGKHAPVGEVPRMLRAEPDGKHVKITNWADYMVEVKVSRALKTARTWERCSLWAPHDSNPNSPTVTTVGLKAGESKLFQARCDERFREGALEFEVGDGRGGTLFKSESAFYPWDPSSRKAP